MSRYSPPSAHQEEIRRASPPASAYIAEPLSVSEIDAHPDAARIWATVMEAREESQSLTLKGYNLR